MFPPSPRRCGLVRHGTYRRRTPEGMGIARYYCHTARETFSLLPDCLASHFPGELNAIEQVVATVETLDLFAAPNVATGEILARCTPQHRARYPHSAGSWTMTGLRQGITDPGD
jgi:hypothetical protein